MLRFGPLLLGALLGLGPASARPGDPVAIVAALNMYGDVARQIGGEHVQVTSILGNPDQDPHLFEASPSAARALAHARIVVRNGADYDPWMEKLIAASPSKDRTVIVVAELIGRKAGDNPHLWYDPATMPAYAKALAADLIGADPANRQAYEHRLATFLASLQPIDARIAALRDRLAGVPVTATEPVFGSMFDALGMVVRNRAFQRAVMNGTEPSASEVAQFEADLNGHKVALLLYNKQATDAIARRMEQLAKQAHLPVVGVTETEPPGRTYQQWIIDVLDAVGRAVPGPGR